MIHSIVVRSLGLAALLASSLVAAPGALRGDTSKLGKEQVRIGDRGLARGKDKECCGYPLSGERELALRFYWLAMQDDFAPDQPAVAIYSREGFFIGSFQEKFVQALLMEGSGLLSDGLPTGAAPGAGRWCRSSRSRSIAAWCRSVNRSTSPSSTG